MNMLWTTRGNNNFALILALQDIYNDMIDILQNASFTLGFQSMLCTGISFFYTIFSSFLCYKGFLSDQDEFKDDALAIFSGCAFWASARHCSSLWESLCPNKRKRFKITSARLREGREIRMRSMRFWYFAIAFNDILQCSQLDFSTSTWKWLLGWVSFSIFDLMQWKQFNYRP